MLPKQLSDVLGGIETELIDAVEDNRLPGRWLMFDGAILHAMESRKKNGSVLEHKVLFKDY